MNTDALQGKRLCQEKAYFFLPFNCVVFSTVVSCLSKVTLRFTFYFFILYAVFLLNMYASVCSATFAVTSNGFSQLLHTVCYLSFLNPDLHQCPTYIILIINVIQTVLITWFWLHLTANQLSFVINFIFVSQLTIEKATFIF